MYIFEGPGIYQSLHRSSTNSRSGIISDICDGQLYKKLVDVGSNSISLLLNTDGVVLFQSKTHSFWPVLLMVNELPFSQRHVTNVIVVNLIHRLH